MARIPHAGLNGSHDGMDAIIGVLGPIARSARDISLFCRVVLQYEPWLVEPSIVEIPWKQDLAEGKGIPPKLCFGVLLDDGVVAPHPPILNALKRTTDALIKAGHEVIPWEPLDHQEAWDLLVCNLSFFFKKKGHGFILFSLADETLFPRWRSRISKDVDQRSACSSN